MALPRLSHMLYVLSKSDVSVLNKLESVMGMKPVVHSLTYSSHHSSTWPARRGASDPEFSRNRSR